MPSWNVYFWKRLFPLVRRFCRERGVAFNRVVNLALEQFLGCCDVEELRVWAEIAKLCREDSELRRVSSVMLRSGSYLPKYADKLFRPGWDSEGRSTSEGFHYVKPRKGDVPLKALSPKEEAIMRRVLARRERIAQRIAELLDRVLPREKFRLKPRRRSRSRRREHTPVKNVRDSEKE